MTQNTKPGSLGALTKLSTSNGGGALQKRQGITSLSASLKTSSSPLDAQARDVLDSSRTSLMQSTMKSALDTRDEVALQKAADEIKLRIAVCLDFTASTSNLVQQFRQHSSDIVNGLRNPMRSVEVLPVAFYGDKSRNDSVSYLASSGDVGNMSWWDGIENVTNNRNEPPVVAGLQEISKRNFFAVDSSILNVGIIAADEGMVKDSGYEQVVSYLLKTNALVISILENNSDSMMQSYEDLLGKSLGERNTVITNSRSPVTLARDFIEYYLREKAKILGSVSSQTLKQDSATDKLSGLSKFLQRKGHESLSISQGSGIRLLTQK